MKPVISQNRYNDPNLKERDPLLRPFNHLTGEPVKKFTVHRLGEDGEFHPEGEAILEEVIECHEELMAGDGKHGE